MPPRPPHWKPTPFQYGNITLDYRDTATTWTVKDNLFQNGSLSPGTLNFVNSNNGYSTNLTQLPGSGGGDKTITNVDYQVSFLGDFYYPTSGGHLSQLINAGSRASSSAGLTDFTTTTNQVADSGTVDIGYHYFAVNPNVTVTIQASQNAIEPIGGSGGQDGKFTVFRTGQTNSALTVYYNVSGTAVPGTDYQALSGSVTIGTNNASQEILVHPIDNNTVTLEKTVVASLILTNTYFVGSPSQATVKIQDGDVLSTNVVVANLNVPVGIDYHSPSNSLIVAINNPTGETNNFARITTNGAVSSWTTLHGMGQHRDQADNR